MAIKYYTSTGGFLFNLGGISRKGGRCVVTITSLKKWAREELPEGSALREILLSEKNTLEGKEFLAKAEVWLKLVKME